MVISDDVSSIVVKPTELPRAPVEFAIQSLTPNPASDVVTATFDIPSNCHVLVEVFDVFGRKIDRIADSHFRPGPYSIKWKHPSLWHRVSTSFA